MQGLLGTPRLPEHMRYSDYIEVEEQKSAGTNGGTSSTSFLARDLNTIVSDEAGHCRLLSNQLYLTPGVYWVRGMIDGYATASCRTRLYNARTAQLILVSLSDYAGNTFTCGISTLLAGYMHIEEGDRIEFQERVGASQATIGLGRATSYDAVERYARLQLWRARS